MNKITPPELISEIKNLIAYSVSNPDLENSNFRLLHRAIIKKYFEAKNVQIDYVNQTIDLQLPVGKKKYTTLNIECQDLERFLKSCLKKDDKSVFFYQSILNHYNMISAA